MCNQHSNVLVEIPGATPRGHLGTQRAIEKVLDVISTLVRAFDKEKEKP